jgi:virginiamycin B lyase
MQEIKEMNRVRAFLCLSILFSGILAAQLAFSATVEGRISDTKGSAVAGAMVTLFSGDNLYSETSYTSFSGRYQINTNLIGKARLRVRAPMFIDSLVDVKLKDKQALEKDFSLSLLNSQQAISESLPANAHFAQLKFKDENERERFILNCIGCHEIGSAMTRRARPEAEWNAFVQLMLDRINVQDKDLQARYVELLSEAFDGTPVSGVAPAMVNPVILDTHIREWKLPGSLIGHDMIAHSDGKYYTIDMGADKIYITDPITNTTETISIPAQGLELGGKIKYSHAAKRAIFALTLHHGPHSLQEGPDGRIYTTDVVSARIGVFDPVSRKFSGYELGEGVVYPHTLRFDAQGTLWFTIGMSNQIGRLRPDTGEVKIIDLPKNDVTYPYGIDINPKDGSVWYAQFTANRIGRVDAKTLTVEEFDVPFSGPRRLRFSADGMLWISAFASGSLVKLDPQSMKYTEYDIPAPGPGKFETPYAVYVHPLTQDVWMTANMSDHLYRFIPSEERFIAYPLPTRGSFMRDIVLAQDGSLCGTSSSIPASASEGGMQALICLAPNDAVSNP